MVEANRVGVAGIIHTGLNKNASCRNDVGLPRDRPKYQREIPSETLSEAEVEPDLRRTTIEPEGVCCRI